MYVKITMTVKRKRREFGAPCNFSDRNVGDAKDAFVECNSYEDRSFDLKRIELDKSIQVCTLSVSESKVNFPTTFFKESYQLIISVVSVIIVLVYVWKGHPRVPGVLCSDGLEVPPQCHYTVWGPLLLRGRERKLAQNWGCFRICKECCTKVCIEGFMKSTTFPLLDSDLN